MNETFVIGGELEVGRLGFGAMRLTGPGVWGEPADPAGARALLRDVVQAGVNLIDTADSYGPEVSERLIAEALRPYPQDLVIATKGGFTRPGPGVWEPDGHPARLRRCCEASLLRLGLERIDLYQLHTVDPRVPIEDSIAALAELREEEKIRFIGVSNVSVEQLERARSVTEIASVQNRFNLLDRHSQDVLEVCAGEGLAFLPWFPLASGELARSAPALDEIARAHRATRAQVALAWLLHRHPVTCRSPARARASTSGRTSPRPSSSSRPRSSRGSTRCRAGPSPNTKPVIYDGNVFGDEIRGRSRRCARAPRSSASRGGRAGREELSEPPGRTGPPGSAPPPDRAPPWPLVGRARTARAAGGRTTVDGRAPRRGGG